MKLLINTIHYKVRCEIDGCSNRASVGISGRVDRPAGCLHLCSGCFAQLAMMGSEVCKPPRSPENIYKKTLRTGKSVMLAPIIIKEDSMDETGYRA